MYQGYQDKFQVSNEDWQQSVPVPSNNQCKKASKDEMESFKQPTNEQATEADRIGHVSLFNDILIKDSCHEVVVVDRKVVEYNDVAA